MFDPTFSWLRLPLISVVESFLKGFSLLDICGENSLHNLPPSSLQRASFWPLFIGQFLCEKNSISFGHESCKILQIGNSNIHRECTHFFCVHDLVP